MDRRNFLQMAALAVAGQAAERVWPFRVYSIPNKIVVRPQQSLFVLNRRSTDAGNYAITPEILRRMQSQIMAALGKDDSAPYRLPTAEGAKEHGGLFS